MIKGETMNVVSPFFWIKKTNCTLKLLRT